jgi:PWI domain
MQKVKIDVLKPWITQRITDLLGMEDDVVVEFVFNQLDDDKVVFFICYPIRYIYCFFYIAS